MVIIRFLEDGENVVLCSTIGLSAFFHTVFRSASYLLISLLV